MAPLTIPQRPQGGLRAPFLDYPPGECGGSAVRLRRRRELDLFRVTAGQGASLLPVVVGSWFLGSAVPANTLQSSWFLKQWGLLALLLRQRVANLGSRSGEQGRRSSLQERTFVCN